MKRLRLAWAVEAPPLRAPGLAQLPAAMELLQYSSTTGGGGALSWQPRSTTLWRRLTTVTPAFSSGLSCRGYSRRSSPTLTPSGTTPRQNAALKQVAGDAAAAAVSPPSSSEIAGAGAKGKKNGAATAKKAEAGRTTTEGLDATFTESTDDTIFCVDTSLPPAPRVEEIKDGESEELIMALRGSRKTNEVMEKFINLDVLDKAAELLGDGEVFIQEPLHSMEVIPEKYQRIVEARIILIDYTCRRDMLRMRRAFTDCEDVYKADLRGKSFYIRLVDEQQRHGFEADTQKHHELLLARIEAIIADYTLRTIKPFPNEITFDLTHYATYLPLLEASRRNIRQLSHDADNVVVYGVIERKTVEKEVTPDDLEPLAPRVLAAELARRIRQEVLMSDAPADGEEQEEAIPSSSSSRPKSPAKRQQRVLKQKVTRVCIGVASSPVLAKIACDGEVLVVRRKVKNGEAVPLVSVRSFYEELDSLKARRSFMDNVPVTHMPLFTPAFAQLLQKCFQIRTCGELYSKRNLLYFCFPFETFSVCYSTIFGQMRFPQETKTVLIAPKNLETACGPVRVLSSHNISILNAARTEFRMNFRSLRREDFNSPLLFISDANHAYGRLASDEGFLAVVERMTHICINRLRMNGICCNTMRLILRHHVKAEKFSIRYFEDTDDAETIMKFALDLGREMAAKRHRGGIDMSGLAYRVHIVLSGFSCVPMIPLALMNEAEQLVRSFIDTKVRLLHCIFVRKGGKAKLDLVDEKSPSIGIRKKRTSKKMMLTSSENDIDEATASIEEKPSVDASKHSSEGDRSDSRSKEGKSSHRHVKKNQRHA